MSVSITAAGMAHIQHHIMAHGMANKGSNNLWVKNNLKDYKWKDIDTQMYALPGWKDKALWWIGRILSLKYLYGYIADFTLAEKLQSGGSVYAGFYYFLVLASIYVLFKDFQEARIIIKSDDVSDSFMDPEALRYINFFYYERACLLKKLKSTWNFSDKLCQFARNLLDDWKRHLIHAGQCGILIAVNIEQQDKCEEAQIAADALTASTGEYHEPQTLCPADYKLVFLILKFIIGFGQLFGLFVACMAYPCLRLYIVSELGSVATDFTTFCTFRIDVRLNALLNSKGAGAPEQKLTPSQDQIQSTGGTGETVPPESTQLGGSSSSGGGVSVVTSGIAPAGVTIEMGTGYIPTTTVTSDPALGGGYARPEMPAYAAGSGDSVVDQGPTSMPGYHQPQPQHHHPGAHHPHPAYAQPQGPGFQPPASPMYQGGAPAPAPASPHYGGAPPPAAAEVPPKMVQCGGCHTTMSLHPGTPVGTMVSCPNCHGQFATPF